MCTAFQRVLTRYPYHKSLKSFQNTTKKNYKQKSLETTNCDSSDYCVKEKKKPPHQCGSHAKWKLRKRKHLHFFFGILYFSYGKKKYYFLQYTCKFLHLFGKEKSRQIDAVWCCLAGERCDLTSFFSDFFILLWLASLAFGYYGQPLVKLRFLYGKKIPRHTVCSIMICNSLVVKSFSNIYLKYEA